MRHASKSAERAPEWEPPDQLRLGFLLFAMCKENRKFPLCIQSIYKADNCHGVECVYYIHMYMPTINAPWIRSGTRRRLVSKWMMNWGLHFDRLHNICFAQCDTKVCSLERWHHTPRNPKPTYNFGRVWVWMTGTARCKIFWMCLVYWLCGRDNRTSILYIQHERCTSETEKGFALFFLLLFRSSAQNNCFSNRRQLALVVWHVGEDVFRLRVVQYTNVYGGGGVHPYSRLTNSRAYII